MRPATAPNTSTSPPASGVDLILGGFLHFQEIEYFGARVLPLVREIEAVEASSADAPALARCDAGTARWLGTVVRRVRPSVR
jgi:hypothetical protein